MLYYEPVNTVREMPRRPTREEEARLLRAAQRLRTARRANSERQKEFDQTVLEIRQANVRVADIADVLGLTRARVYAAIERAEGHYDYQADDESESGPGAA
jgi:hypothetical protein